MYGFRYYIYRTSLAFLEEINWLFSLILEMVFNMDMVQSFWFFIDTEIGF
jgi:hypothetical protein